MCMEDVRATVLHGKWKKRLRDMRDMETETKAARVSRVGGREIDRQKGGAPSGEVGG